MLQAKKIPKSGYINVKDFKSAEDLSKYLLSVAETKTAYNSYFKWKKYAQFDAPHADVYCDMCVHLNLCSFKFGRPFRYLAKYC